MKLEHAFGDALVNPQSLYGIDDLNIMIGDFTGNYTILKKLSGLKFKKFKTILQSSSLS